MNPWLFLSLAVAAIAVAVWIPHYRLQRALRAPFPDEWVGTLERNVPLYPRMPQALRAQLRRLIKQFLHQKQFFGAGGLEMTDEIRVTIAAEACMLLLNRACGVYPRLRYIIVYPTAFLVEQGDIDEAGVVDPSPRDLTGESWHEGKVILAWDSVQRGAQNFVDGQNVVLHEFAHQLDSETGDVDGTPLLGGTGNYRRWAEVLSGEFIALQEDSRRGRPSLLDPYGAENPAEFFAVATETFFENPQEMAEHHRELYDTLKAYYRVDPRSWTGDAGQ